MMMYNPETVPWRRMFYPMSVYQHGAAYFIDLV